MADIILKLLSLPIVVLVAIATYMTTKIDWHEEDWLLMTSFLISVTFSTIFVLTIWLR